MIFDCRRRFKSKIGFICMLLVQQTQYSSHRLNENELNAVQTEHRQMSHVISSLKMYCRNLCGFFLMGMKTENISPDDEMRDWNGCY